MSEFIALIGSVGTLAIFATPVEAGGGADTDLDGNVRFVDLVAVLAGFGPCV